MNFENVVCYSMYLSDKGSSAYLRIIEPLRRLGKNIVNGIENNQIIIEKISEGDIVLIQRAFLFIKGKSKYKEIIDYSHHEGKPVVYDLDDLLFDLPENHPDRQSAIFGTDLLPMFQTLLEADLVTVSTSKLRDVLVGCNLVKVLPNFLDDHLWHLTPPVLKNSSEQVLTIGYMGTYSHQPDLELITPVLLEMIHRYPKMLHFHFWGLKPPPVLGSLPQVQWTPWHSDSYDDFARFFQTQTADIFIAPLIDTLFNRCKSPLKYFEYSALGVPGVYSRLNSYEEVITHNQDGLLASSLEEWTECLIHLIENDEFRFQLAVNAQENIKKNWLLSNHGFLLEDIFQSASDQLVSNKEKNHKINNILKSVSLQVAEAFEKKETNERELLIQVKEKDRTIQTLTAELDQARNELEPLQAEVLGYALSRSWQLTRPLRMLKSKILRIFGDVNAKKME